MSGDEFHDVLLIAFSRNGADHFPGSRLDRAGPRRGRDAVCVIGNRRRRVSSRAAPM